MNKEQTLQLLEIMGITEVTLTDSWANFRCPLALTRHEKGYDRRPSAGISIHETKPSVYKCFSCLGDTFKPLPWLFYAYWLCHGEYPYEAARYYVRGEIPVFEIKFEKIAKWNRKEKMVALPFQQEILDRFPLLNKKESFVADRCQDLLEKRGISKKTSELFGVRYSKDQNCLVFPMTLLNGKIYYFAARAWDSKAFWGITKERLGVDEDHPNYKPTLKESGAWFGYHLVDWKRPVLLVEGPLDALRLASLGVTNVIASGGTSVTSAQIKNLIGSKYLLGYDADKAGQKANLHLMQELDATCWIMDWSLASCMDKKTGKPKPCKDGGDLESFDDYLMIWREAKNPQITHNIS